MVETNKTPSQEEESVPASRVSRAPFFGAVLVGVFLLFLLLIIAALSWGVYRGYRLNQEKTLLPSISALSLGEAGEAAVEEEEKDTTPEEVSDDVTTDEVTMKKVKAAAIKVLNGGAPKGSASVLAETLKKDGYTQVTTGNTIKDYAGVVIYFSPEMEKEATVVKNTLLKSYPKISMQPAVKTNTETTQAPLAVIFGK